MLLIRPSAVFLSRPGRSSGLVTGHSHFYAVLLCGRKHRFRTMLTENGGYRENSCRKDSHSDESLVDPDDLLIEKAVVVKYPAVVMQMAIEPFPILHNLPKRFKVPVQFIDFAVTEENLV